MIKDIKYSGITTVPSDYESPDGALSESLNLISEDQHLTPIFQPKQIVQLQTGCKVIGIHRTSQYTHYIVYNETSYDLSWMDEGNAGTLNDIAKFYSFKNIEFIGNTLIILSEDSINYFLWKEDEYIKLGDHLPNIEISFGLKGKPRFYSVSDDSKSTFHITFDGIDEDKLYEIWSEANKKKITDQIMAKVNKFLRDQTVNKGRFALPFMVRYALRLYDGSLVCHSAPILMNPSTFAAPIVYWHASGKGRYTDADCDIMLVSSSLDYKLVADDEYDYLYLTKNWSDIIKSVDVFISAPIYTYDQNGECSSFADTDNFCTKFIGALDVKGFSSTVKEDFMLLPVTIDGTTMGPGSSTSAIASKYTEWPYSKLYELYKNPSRDYPSTTINLPEFSSNKVRESIENVSNFYMLYSIKLNDLDVSKRKDIVVGKEYLQSLVSRETMTDDYLTHDRLIAQFAHGYNLRLNLAGVKRELFRGFYASSMFAFNNNQAPMWERIGEGDVKTIKLEFGVLAFWNLEVEVYIKENGTTYVIHNTDREYLSYILSETLYPSLKDKKAGTNGYLDKRSWGCYVFYPNRNAFKMVIKDGKGRYVYELKAHDFLNGSYCFMDYELQRKPSTDSLPSVTSHNNTIDVSNKIYTSEVNNPFYFPVTGINSVGTGEILGISSATKALSQGQFGQFPLYAFTDEGVWALEVSSTGTYSAKQPITRDVCINASSITQLDNAVLFATSRGIMLISGSQTVCITDYIDSQSPFNALTLPGMEQLHKLTGHTSDTCFPTVPFLTFLGGCSMLYDYVHQHIVVFNKSYTYAYVYSLKSKEWGMMYSTFSSAINSYPDALAMTRDNKLVSFSNTDEELSTGLFLTRPIKIETPDVLKTIDTCIQRGMFKRGDVQTVLWGSRDLYSWQLIGSSVDNFLRGVRGTPYKYFRIAGITKLRTEMSLFGVSIQYTPKFTNIPR